MTSIATQTNDTNPTLQFDFTGNANEYFKIWIVNIFLTILTLGIYSAWAKVRSNQYFYGNTYLDGSSFRYTANPIAILKGRVIAVAVLVLYSAIRTYSPEAAVVELLIVFTLLPAVIVRSMAFRLHNTVYRNLRFHFNKDYRKAYLVFFLPLFVLGMIVASAGLLQGSDNQAMSKTIGLVIIFSMLIYTIGVPFLDYLKSWFLINNSSYGAHRFSIKRLVARFYGMYLKTGLVGFLLFLPAGALQSYMASSKTAEQGSTGLILMNIAVLGLMILAYLLVFAYFNAKRFNLIYSNSSIPEYLQLKAELNSDKLAKLYISNAVMIILTLGLAIPWAKIRSARLHIEAMQLQPLQSLSLLTAADDSHESALGEELGEAFDLDIGL